MEHRVDVNRLRTTDGRTIRKYDALCLLSLAEV